MDTKTIFVLTPKGDEEVAHKTSLLYGDIKRALSMIDGVSTYAEISKRAAPSLRTILAELVKELLTGGFIQDKSRAGFMAKIVVPAKSAPAPAPSTPPKQEQGGSELDFTTIMRAPSADMLRAEAAKFQAEQIARKEAEQQKLKAEQEAAKAKQMVDAENARRAQEHEARLKAVQAAEARAKQEAEEKARKEAEARAKQEAEEKARKEAEARAKHEAEEKARKEAEARAKYEAEEKARKEAEARAKYEAEEKARKEAEARAKQEAEEKARKETEARAKQEAEEKARKEAELAREEAERRARAQAEIVRLKAEQEAEKARIEAELAKKKAEAEAREEAERRAKAEIEAARSNAEKEAAKAKAELEQARIKAEAEAKLKQEAEAARLQAEQDAAQARAEVERVKKESELAAAQAKEEAERIKKEAELMAAKAKEEADRAKQEAEAARLKAEAEAEAARLKAEAEAARAREELEAARLKVEQEEIARAEAETARLAAEHIAAQALVVAEQKKLQELEQLAIQAREEEKIRAKQHALAAASTQVRDTPYDTSKPPEPSALKLDAFDLDALDIKPDPAVAAAKASEAARASEIKAQGPSAEELKAKELALKEQAKKAEEARLAEELSAKKLADAQAKAWAEAEKRAAQSAKAHVEHLAQQSAQNAQAKQQSEMKLNAAMKKKRKPVPWTGIAIGVLLIAVLAVFIVPMTLPTQQYANNLEVMLAKNLKQPVHIGKMSLRILPTPRIDLGEIYIGEVKQVKAQQAQLSFGFGALFSDVKRVERLELQGAELNNSGLLIVPAWLQQMSADAKYPISHIAFSGMKVNGDVVQLTDVDGEVDFSPKGQITGALLHAKGGKYALDIKATPEGKFATTFNLRNSALPLLPNWSFEDMTAKGELTQDGLVVSEFDSRIAGGVLQGDARLDWKNGWSVQGSLNAKSISLASLSKLLEGDMDGVARFKMQADSLANLADSASLDGTLVAKKGLINGVDIVETARLHSKDHLPGGRTHFDQLDSTLLYTGNAYHFKSIKIVNSVMNASANVDIVKQQLSGRISAHLSITEGMGTVDLQVGGASDNPNLRAIR